MESKKNKVNNRKRSWLYVFVVISIIGLIGCIYIFNNKRNLNKGNVVELIVNNKLDEAKTQCDKLLNENKKNYLAYNYRAFIEFELDMKDKAYEDLKKSIEIEDNQNQLAYGVKAYLQLKDGDVEGAKKSVENSKNIKASDEFEQFILGSLYANTSDKNKAIDYFNLAIGKNKNYSRAFSSRGEVYLALKENEKALKDFETAISLDKENYYGVSGKIKVLVSMKEYDKAIELGESSLKNAKTKNVDLLYSLISAYTHGKDYDRLLNLGEELIKNNKSFEGYFYKGWAYYNLSQYNKAIEAFDKTIKINDRDSSSYNIKAWCYSALKKYKEAKNDFKKAIEINERYFDAYRGLAWAHNNLNEQDESIKICEKALELDKNNANLYACLGWNYLDKKDYKKAQENFEKSLSINKEDVDAKNGMKLINK